MRELESEALKEGDTLEVRDCGNEGIKEKRII
jgi:hypothetical protein